MRCPNCQFDHPSQTTECLKCKVVFGRYRAPHAVGGDAQALFVPIAAAGHAPLAAASALASPSAEAEQVLSVTARTGALREFTYRVIALPLTLLMARLAVGTFLNGPASLLAMLLHETGHAITSWLTGRWAIPMLWVTQHGESRSWGVVFLVTAAVVGLGYVAWQARRWGWVTIAGLALFTQLMFLAAPAPAGAMIVFGGDGGALVLGTILMMTFYAPAESWLRNSPGLRWGLLVIGALAFMCVYHVWSGPLEDLPFGEIEGVNLSDPSILTEMYGWSVLQLVDRYLLLANFCFAGMTIAYFWGCVSGYANLVVQSRRASGEVSQ